jgi:predicted aspartyl protease
MHSLRKASLALLLGATAVTAFAADLPETLAQMRAAHGGAAWDKVSWLRMEGDETTDGLHGKVSVIVDRATGQFVRRSDFKLYRTADGIDEAGRWRQDATRGLHPLDSSEARAVAASESWLNRRAYLDSHDSAAWRDAGAAALDGVALDKLEATPPGGRTVTLWLDQRTHLVRRAEMLLSSSRFVQRYDGYRAVGALVLPSRVGTTAYDADTESVVDHAAWSAAAPADRKALARPAYPGDARIAGGAASATMPVVVGERGILVSATIDGKGPLRFILDTGAYAILSRRTADALGIKGAGAGAISGVGGSIQTEIAKVHEVKMGAASMRDIPFLVHEMPKRVFTENGREVEIAGLLGLELFERFAVRLDLPNQQMTLTPFASYQSGPARGEQLPLHFTEDVPLVAATINGHAADVMVDTGNLRKVTVLGAFAKRTGIDKAFEGGKQVKVRGGTGAQAVHLEGSIARLELGSHVWEQLPANVAYEEEGPLSSRSEAANLSLTLLKHFDVTFDYKHGLMTIAPSRPREKGALAVD